MVQFNRGVLASIIFEIYLFYILEGYVRSICIIQTLYLYIHII